MDIDYTKGRMIVKTWIFQGNPTKFNVDGYLLENQFIWWSIRQAHFAEDIRIGDEVYIWRSDGGNKSSGGVIARSVVVSLPQEYTNDEESLNYWYEDVSGSTYLAVELEVLEVEATNGLNRLELHENEVLSELHILRLRQNTNYLLSEEQGSHLRQLWHTRVPPTQGTVNSSFNLTVEDGKQLEAEFHKAMVEVSKSAKAIGYNPTRFTQLVANEGGYTVAKKLINSASVSDGFNKLWEINRLDLTVEAVILKPEFNALFTNDERLIVKERLAEFGYFINEEPIIWDQGILKVVKADIEAEQIEEGQRTEGKVKYYYGKRYERDSVNRAEAIKHHGLNCMACGFNFGNIYGERGKDFIEVHHLKPLSTLEEAIEINPKTDLIPLCANCHRMVHRRKDDVLGLGELKELLGMN